LVDYDLRYDSFKHTFQFCPAQFDRLNLNKTCWWLCHSFTCFFILLPFCNCKILFIELCISNWSSAANRIHVCQGIPARGYRHADAGL